MAWCFVKHKGNYTFTFYSYAYKLNKIACPQYRLALRWVLLYVSWIIRVNQMCQAKCKKLNTNKMINIYI